MNMLGYLPAAVPNVSLIADVNPEAAKAANKFYAFEAELPARPSPDQVNELEELRGEVLSELGNSFFEDLDVHETKLRGRLAEQIAMVSQGWNELESVAALRAWRQRPQSFNQPRSWVLAVPTGVGGHKQPIFGSQAISALADFVQKGA